MTPKRQAIFPLFILICSIIYLIEAVRLGQPVTAEGIRPSFVPMVIGALSSIFSLILTLKALGQNEVKPPSDEYAAEAAKPLVSPAVLTIIAISIYIALFQMIGYALSSLIFVFAITTIFSERNRWLHKLATSAAVVAFGYIVFEQLFGVRLPALWG
ncbi:MAG TPA: tripartite tricarboxylate transporter TctB family protein [Denitromonas sp.]|mgnify:CR=1 FL=1|uniref:tripartite tricarboxylate transporter TctB family protein n=1 Tax=Denitromonas sp. TaxID=2734609 RepID=UPI001DD43519|nr:tripartite tricarboxylate transporter TctB family protein [Rhodocyclaceae bacterium]MCP5221230.1 tripartite tricarboxylate transporter TctB family protein [Zoogloeaceae bacterium]HQU88327.1 tripartite tricarboxylate transporter TctB family protein [Denitromonas sp.]HQV14297.1 tripartite tricarboxylate transporter TctB family protein [Denitromonas sp.]